MSIINAEQQAKVRQYRYAAAAVVAAAGPALAVALAQGGVSKWIAVAVAAAGVISGTAGSAVAASKTKTQRADGMFADPEPVEAPDVLDVVTNGLTQLSQEKDDALAKYDQATAVAGQVLGLIVPDIATKVEQAVRAARSVVD